MEDQCQHIKDDKEKYILSVLMKLEDLFDVTLGTCNMSPVYLESKENAKPGYL